MSRSLRRYDSLGRVGGEEFLILTPGVDAADAENLFERIRKRIAQTRIRYEGQLIKVTASIGVVTTAGEGSADRLFALADQALYRAKEAGRNRVEVLSMTLTENGKSRLVKMA
ncbi:MAG: GGDEF domain-containing protein [Thermoleophilia bacterium]|nr:GGDEF domain-containing protein [Thermoleophilia bacterium]